MPVADSVEQQFNPVGIDFGRSSLVALSTGETVPQHPAKAAKTFRRTQAAIGRHRRNRQHEIRLRAARLDFRVANRRLDFSHKPSGSLVERFTHLAIADLNIKGLARGMLAKSIANAAWNQLVQHVRYKAECAGTFASMVDPRGPSQTCPKCGAITPQKPSESGHRCDCSCVLHRDVAAAQIVELRANFRPGRGLQALTERVAAKVA